MPMPQPLQSLSSRIRHPPLSPLKTTNRIFNSRHNQRQRLRLLNLERRSQLMSLRK